MSRKPHSPAIHAFERLEPRILLSADILGGAFDTDVAGGTDQDRLWEIDSEQDLNQLIAPLLQSDKEKAESHSIELNTPLASLSFAQLDSVIGADTQGVDGFDQLTALLAGTLESDGDRQELIFIDTATPDYEQLVTDITNRDKQIHYVIYLLDGEQDGIQQINDLLAGHNDIDAIHLVGHGSEGNISLGNSLLNGNSIHQYTALLNNWQTTLNADADLLIYGCNLAGNEAGRDLVKALGQLTGADIAASEDLTGAATLGGDWDLEYRLGEVETQIVFSQQLQQNWQGTLATFVVNTTADTIDANVGDGLAQDAMGNTSLRAAIMEANFDAAADEIQIGPGIYNLAMGSGDDNATSGDLDILEDLTITGTDAVTTVIDGRGLDRVFEIRNSGTVVNMTNLTIQGGSVSNQGGGIHIQNGSAQLTADHLIIGGNSADKGAGIFNKGTLILTDSIITGNGTPTGAEGGGLSNHNVADLNRVTISANKAIDGAGLHQDNSATQMKLTNVTVSSNDAGNNGGGLYSQESTTILNSTFAFNSAGNGGGIYQDSGTVNIKNSIVSNNIVGTGTGHDVWGTYNSLGHNLIQNTTGSLGFGGTDILGGAADLGLLANNGGFGQTHALLATSNAIDPAGLSGAPGVDQNNNLRDLLPDIGAFEFGTANNDPKLANPISDQGATEDSPFSFQFANNAFTDDDGDNLTYTARLSGGGALPAWLSFDGGTRTFSGTPLNGDVGTISVEVTADDGNGGTPATDTFDIVVGNSNDDPTLVNPINNQAATEDSPFSFTFAAGTFGDVDSGDTLTYTVRLAGGGALPAWLSFDGGTRTFSGTPLNGDVGTISVEITADDSNGGTPATDTFDIVVGNSNDDPTLDNAISDQNAIKHSPFNFTFAANTFGDVDAGDTLTYSSRLVGGGALPAWLSFDGNTRTFSGTPSNGDVGTVKVEVIADDGNGGTPASTRFDIVVNNSNANPILVNAINNQAATEDTPFNFTFAANTFNDLDADTLTYTAKLSGGGALPAWLNFDSATRTFSGTPGDGDTGAISVEVTADDGKGGTPSTANFDLVISNINDNPKLVNPVADQIATEESAFSFTFAANTFTDPDRGDTLTYSAHLTDGTPLPGWLSFDGNTRTFSGTPSQADIGALSIEIVADDGHGSTVAKDTFNLSVNNRNDNPTGTVTIDGDLNVGSRLTADNNLADKDGMGTVSYQWQRNGVDISGATGDTYILTNDDLGSGISVVANYIDGQGTKETVASDALLLTVDIETPPDPSSESEDNSTQPDISDSETETTETSEEITEETPAGSENELPQLIDDEHGSDEEQAAAELLTEKKKITSGISSSVDIRPEQVQFEVDFDETIGSEPETSLISSIQYNFTPLSDPTLLVSTQEFIRGIDQLREEVANESRISKTFVGSSFAVSASLSAGYVVWLARSGVLLSGVLSALPAWRFIDPLPVLANAGTGEDGDDESLESLVDHQDAEAAESEDDARQQDNR